jgi:hypothetical protein
MKFSSKEDIEAPIGEVFAELAEFENFERLAIRRGADVVRLGNIAPPQEGMGWQVGFGFRGKQRNLAVTLAEYVPGSRMLVTGEGDGLSGRLAIELLALSPRRTRMSVQLMLEPKTIPARLLIQSLKLAKTRISQKFKHRVAEFAGQMEERLGRAA